MTLVGIKALKEEDMSVDQMAVELKKKLRSKCRVANRAGLCNGKQMKLIDKLIN